jgi:hypothetical protein
MEPFTVETSGVDEAVPCDVCGDTSRSASGYVRGGGGETAYVVHWTETKSDHGAQVDLLMAADPAHFAAALEFSATSEEPGFMVIDARQRKTWNAFPNVKRLSREDVIGTPLASLVFSIVDAIWVQDPRLRGLHG